MKKSLETVLSWLISLAVPVILSTLAILVLLSPLFINLEYRRPGFPADRYGFTRAERLQYGNLTRRYLLSRQDLGVLRELEFEGGEPLYLERELTHLRDVKIVLAGLLKTAGTALGILALAVVYSRLGKWKGFILGVSRGGRITAAFLVGILLLTLISFRALFTNFHLIFFEGDSWLFAYSDTLIRLFPMQFWQDAFIVFGLLTLSAGVALGWGLPAVQKQNKQGPPHK